MCLLGLPSPAKHPLQDFKVGLGTETSVDGCRPFREFFNGTRFPNTRLEQKVRNGVLYKSRGKLVLTMLRAVTHYSFYFLAG